MGMKERKKLKADALVSNVDIGLGGSGTGGERRTGRAAEGRELL